jgi:hypothetical protein
MLSDLEIDYGTLLRYSVYGGTKKGDKSKVICGKLKNGDSAISSRAAEIIKNDYSKLFEDFFNENTILVPMPRSAPLTNNALWPAKVICDEFRNLSLCADVQELLIRNTKVPKSSHQNGGGNRPSIKIHYDSFLVKPVMLPFKNIVIVDDVLTLGRTSTAAIFKIKELYPEHTVKVFSIMRTRSREKKDVLIEPQIGIMRFRQDTGNVQLPD